MGGCRKLRKEKKKKKRGWESLRRRRKRMQELRWRGDGDWGWGERCRYGGEIKFFFSFFIFLEKKKNLEVFGGTVQDNIDSVE